MTAWKKPLQPGAFEPGPFPIEALPARLRAYVVAVAEHACADTDAPAMFALAAIATCVQSKYRVQIYDGYQEALALQVLVAMDTGCRKTPIEKHIRKPFDHAFAAEIRRAEFAHPLWQAQLERAKDAHKQAQRSTEDANGQQLARALRIVQTLEESEPLPRKLVIGADCTLEGVIDALVDNDGTLAIIDGEGSKLISMVNGRWSNGIIQPEVHLKGYTGETYDVTRSRGGDKARGRRRYVQYTQLSQALMVQPVLLQRLLEKPELRQTGFHARQLWVCPKSRRGYMKSRTPAVPHDLESWWSDFITNLLPVAEVSNCDDVDLDAPAQHQQPALQAIHFSGEADRKHASICDQIQELIRPGCKWSAITDWASKAGGHLARIAAVLHVAAHDDFATRTLEVETLVAAGKITLWLAGHAAYAIAQIASWDDTDRGFDVAEGWLRRRQLTNPAAWIFRAADIRAGHRKTWARSEDLTPILEAMEALHWITRSDDQNADGQQWLVNPRLFREEFGCER